ncbi:LysR family transcriptional regulator [Metabacillus litoralis]|uniref:LysR family transcriptional regulator n=1 Tax=Metabacillus litoralis TaxID=152268 RepID=UPI001CFCD151|nr:LysR family transcriptional regulator [Metabacillus litoralis]
MEIKWLKTFIIAATHENFRKTAEELFLTQPAITKHIKRLEENLDIQLFERIGKKIVLTSAGSRFLPHAKEIVSLYDQGLTDFELWKQGYKKRLVIATSPQIAASVLPLILRSFMDKYPDIEVLINVCNSYDIGEEVSDGRADLGLTRIQPTHSTLHCEEVHKESVILVASYLEEEGKEMKERQVLEKYRLITHNHPEYWDFLIKDIKRHYPFVKTMKVNQIEVSKKFIEHGLGVSYLPLSMVKEEINLRKLVEIKTNQITLPYSSTYVLTKVNTSEVDHFVRYFKLEINKF